MNDSQAGGENMTTSEVLVIAENLGLTTQRGGNYVSLHHAGKRISKEAENRPSVSAAAGIDLPTFAARQDGTSRITIYTGGDDVTISNRKGLFNFNIGTRHLCACKRDGCIGKNGHSYGRAAGDFTGSLCGYNHPDTPNMPTIQVREGRDFHRTIRNMPLFTASGVVGGRVLTERVGGGARGLNADAPEYRRNVWMTKGCPSCDKAQCWGKDKKTGIECFPSMKFAFVNCFWEILDYSEDKKGKSFSPRRFSPPTWVYCYLEPSRRDYAATLAILDSMGSKVGEMPIMGAV
jgi:hypothetical protein